MEMTFGKYKGRSVEEVFSLNPSYFKWMNEKGLTEKDEYIYYIEVVSQEYPESFEWDVEVRTGYKCWSCKGEMDILLLFNPEVINELREGYPVISDLAYSKPSTMIELANRFGVKLQERFSKMTGDKYVMHICPHCNSHQGDYHVVEDNHQNTTVSKTIKINFDVSKKIWRET
ncbi:hypothetical protein MT997_28570 [Paenibacillus sp. OVF10]|nr:hypothetical protein MT997_28570 [Paenibacillus sp. OVF10]